MPHRLLPITNNPPNNTSLPNSNISNHTTNIKASIRAVVEDVVAVEDVDAAIMAGDIINRDVTISMVGSRIIVDMAPRSRDPEDLQQ
jgi:hypothetical protein